MSRADSRYATLGPRARTPGLNRPRQCIAFFSARTDPAVLVAAAASIAFALALRTHVHRHRLALFHLTFVDPSLECSPAIFDPVVSFVVRLRFESPPFYLDSAPGQSPQRPPEIHCRASLSMATAVFFPSPTNSPVVFPMLRGCYSTFRHYFW